MVKKEEEEEEEGEERKIHGCLVNGDDVSEV